MLTYFSEKKNKWLTTSLLACESDAKNASCVRKLLGGGGVSLSYLLGVTDENGWTVLQLAALHNFMETVSLLKDRAQASAEDESGQQVFLAACAHEGVCGMSALLVALASGHEAMACSLLQAGAPTDSTGSRARNCLYLMCRASMPEALGCVLALHGPAAVYGLAAAPDTSGYNALHAAVLAGRAGMCDALLGADAGGDIGRACLCSRSKDDSNVSRGDK
jgi:ankyrin repeat protein